MRTCAGRLSLRGQDASTAQAEREREESSYMSSLRARLTPPQGGDPREALQWLRRMEIVMGIFGLIAAALTWSGEWWSWLIVGGSLLSLSPWPGIGAILRKAEKRPEILISDPERRRERGQRFLRWFVPAYVVVFTLIGYLLLGLGGAIFFFVLGVAGPDSACGCSGRCSPDSLPQLAESQKRFRRGFSTSSPPKTRSAPRRPRGGSKRFPHAP